MTVSKIEPFGSASFKIYIDEEFAFTLRKGEFRRQHLSEGLEISQEQYDQMEEMVVLRAKKYAMHLLEDMDRTESQLRTKLRQKGYAPVQIDTALAYVMKFGYVNDAGYARRVIRNKMSSKSQIELIYYLRQKGLDKEVIDAAMEEAYGEDAEEEAIRALVARKYKNYNPDRDNKEKIIAYLVRKGFKYEKVRQIVESYFA